MNDAVLSVRRLEKVYPNGTAALKSASFDVAGATIHGLIGANGAGKSTLIKILSGAIPASGGEIVWSGEHRDWRRPADAAAAGIATIHQHIPLAGTLSVRENVFLASSRPWRESGFERRRFDELLDAVGYDIDPEAIVDELPIGRRQMVSILQALAADARLLIMDEPTASLSDTERTMVFDTIRRLRDSRGTSVLFISHFLDEILELCQQVTVLRDGVTVLNEPREAIDEQKLIVAIIGREAVLAGENRAAFVREADAPLLDVRGLSSPGRLDQVAFSVRPGEIVGLAGLLGSGRSEIMHAIFGADPTATGSVTIAGLPVPRTIAGAIADGIVLVPEDRIRQALFVNESIRWNTTLPNPAPVSVWDLFPVEALEERRANEIISAFSVVAPNADVLVAELSGGNAQKIALSRALAADCRVLLLDEPTAGVDIGAKADIRRVVSEIAAAGTAIVVAISDFEELLAICDRVLVVSEGRIIAERRAADTSEHELMALAGGLTN
ncbi:MAG: sugar ABC transporter ATP-binding protein [Xanthobacteraceae bacterium]